VDVENNAETSKQFALLLVTALPAAWVDVRIVGGIPEDEVIDKFGID
jgi:hypothetical protein